MKYLYMTYTCNPEPQHNLKCGYLENYYRVISATDCLSYKMIEYLIPKRTNWFI